MRFRLEAATLSTFKQQGPITTLDQADGGYADLTYPEGPDARQTRRMTVIHVPRTMLFSQHWDNLWCTLHEKQWSQLKPRMMMNNVQCVKGHKLLILAHVSRIEQMDGPVSNFGVRLSYNGVPIAVHFTGAVTHAQFSEINMHTVVNCLELNSELHEVLASHNPLNSRMACGRNGLTAGLAHNEQWATHTCARERSSAVRRLAADRLVCATAGCATATLCPL